MLDRHKLLTPRSDGQSDSTRMDVVFSLIVGIRQFLRVSIQTMMRVGKNGVTINANKVRISGGGLRSKIAKMKWAVEVDPSYYSLTNVVPLPHHSL